MAPRPPLSVVIPSHQGRALTLSCLASLERSSRPGLEVVVVDDGSSDGTSEAVAAVFPAARLVRHEHAQGFTAAANRGLRQATGEILLLLNNDTEVDGPGLAALEARFAAAPGLGIAGGALYYPDGSPQWSGGPAPTLRWLAALASGLPAWLGRLPLYRRLRPVSAGVSRGGSATVAWVTGAAMAIRRAVWEAVGPLDPAFRFYGQDLDFCLRARQVGWDVEVLAAFPVLHHHGATIGGAPGAFARQQLEILWTDLLRWAEKQHGRRWAGRAAAVLAWGGRARLWARRAAGWLAPAGRRRALAEENTALAQALRAVRLARRAILAAASGEASAGGRPPR